MNQAVVVFSFPEPEDPITMGFLIETAKQAFDHIKESRVYLGINDVADNVLSIFDPITKPESNLVTHARTELELAGNDDDFNRSIINAVRAFSSFGHSGGSASVAIPMLNDLLQYKNLTPLTNNPDEWMQVEMGDENCWQSRRNPEAFSKDGGISYYLLSEDGTDDYPKPIHVSVEHKEKD